MCISAKALSPLNYKNKYMLTFHFKALREGKNLAYEELNSRIGSRSLKAGERLKQDLKAWGYARRWLVSSSKKKKKKLLRPLHSFAIWVLLSGSTLGFVLWSFVLNNQSKRAPRQHRMLSCTSEAQMNEERCISLRRFTICPSSEVLMASNCHVWGQLYIKMQILLGAAQSWCEVCSGNYLMWSRRVSIPSSVERRLTGLTKERLVEVVC